MWCLQEGSWRQLNLMSWSVLGGSTKDVVAFYLGKLKSNVNFHCRRGLEGENGAPSVSFVERGWD